MGIESLMLDGDKSNIFDIVKDLFNNENIKMKSDISDMDISIILEINWQNAIKKTENESKSGTEIFCEVIIPLFLELKVSKDRQSRIEAQKILSSIIPTIIQQETNAINEIKKL